MVLLSIMSNSGNRNILFNYLINYVKLRMTDCSQPMFSFKVCSYLRTERLLYQKKSSAFSKLVSLITYIAPSPQTFLVGEMPILFLKTGEVLCGQQQMRTQTKLLEAKKRVFIKQIKLN